jgi:hypothetical protein
MNSVVWRAMGPTCNNWLEFQKRTLPREGTAQDQDTVEGNQVFGCRILMEGPQERALQDDFSSKTIEDPGFHYAPE